MFHQYRQYYRSVRKCKRYYLSGIIIIIFFMIFQPHKSFFRIQRKTNLFPLSIKIEPKTKFSVSIINQDRSKTLSNQCHHSNQVTSNIFTSSSAALTKTYPGLDRALFRLASQSLIYCAVPKVATKTLISLLLYVHVRELIIYLKKNSMHLIMNQHRPEQFINIPQLIGELRKDGISIPNSNDSSSFVSLIETYLHILRFEKINQTSPSLYFNPWRLNLKEIFPDLHFSSLSNISHVLSPTFTRVLFVRHPFERLASAYQERIVILSKDRIQPEPHYDSIRKLICHIYRRSNVYQYPSPKHHSCDTFIPRFEHFVQYILAYADNSASIAQMDAHWQPYSVTCQVCQFQYNFIGKYETFDDDFSSLLKRLNVSDWNVKKRRGASGRGRQDYQRLFSSLSDDLICRLKNLYKDDLQLFNYRIEEYVDRTTLTC